jgi:hypothetical protein
MNSFVLREAANILRVLGEKCKELGREKKRNRNK